MNYLTKLNSKTPHRSALYFLTRPRNILAASTTFLLCTISRNNVAYLHCKAFSSSALFASANNSIPNKISNSNKNKESKSFCSTSSLSSSSNNENIMDTKTTEELQSLWAGGRDVWKAVPIIISPSTSTSTKSSSSSPSSSKESIDIQTKIRDVTESVESYDSKYKNNDWPDIVKSSTLYGFGAYNPRGQIVPDEINQKQHLLLENDIRNGIIAHKEDFDNVYWWQGASLWEDGSSERGVIVAFPKSHNYSHSRNKNDVGMDERKAKEQEFIVELAKKYDQGAIYKFEYIDGRLMRDTIAVLDVGTDASVEVIQDNDVAIDLSLFT
jgi:hypothetical protein